MECVKASRGDGNIGNRKYYLQLNSGNTWRSAEELSMPINAYWLAGQHKDMAGYVQLHDYNQDGLVDILVPTIVESASGGHTTNDPHLKSASTCITGGCILPAYLTVMS